MKKFFPLNLFSALNSVLSGFVLFGFVFPFHFCASSFAQQTDARAFGSLPPIAFAARLVGDDSRFRLLLDFDREISYRAYPAADPNRLVVSLPLTAFALGPDFSKSETSLISEIRYGAVSAEKSHFVLHLEEPVEIVSHTFKPLASSNRHRLILDAVKSDESAFAGSVARAALDADSVLGVRAGSGKIAIALDPGHGGIDGGASGQSRIAEKEITLRFSRILRRKLEAHPDFEVFLTREKDEFIPLRERREFVRAANADLFISIHADSLRQKDIRGATFYTLSAKGSDELSRQLAHRENRADLIAGLDIEQELSEPVSDILLDLTKRETRELSVRFARLAVERLRGEIELIKNPHRAANFFVLRHADVPSVLLELGYLSNSHDERLMQSPEWLEKTADLVAQAIFEFFSQRLARE